MKKEKCEIEKKFNILIEENKKKDKIIDGMKNEINKLV